MFSSDSALVYVIAIVCFIVLLVVSVVVYWAKNNSRRLQALKNVSPRNVLMHGQWSSSASAAIRRLHPELAAVPRKLRLYYSVGLGREGIEIWNYRRGLQRVVQIPVARLSYLLVRTDHAANSVYPTLVIGVRVDGAIINVPLRMNQLQYAGLFPMSILEIEPIAKAYVSSHLSEGPNA
ncbi:hypothetical protein [Lysinibacter cavernae]|uniref:Uncharacterized protein n=1 Tax=Lysinibacter cavernae TaxID=1640652 RepID=A0A7X5R3C2_9MICO|nr:hypothetical protein [Lysinibacter cavernae]NIH54914.1 hypothetical protein [Lysinibacter cavernae]